MTQKPDTTPFHGLWQIDPARSKYERGIPPPDARYRIEPDRGGLKITMEWTAPNGDTFQMIYFGFPDGAEHVYEQTPIAEAISMELVDARTLDTTAKKKGQVVGYARRVLSADGRTMTITQSATTDEGQPYDNVSFYVKIE